MGPEAVAAYFVLCCFLRVNGIDSERFIQTNKDLVLDTKPPDKFIFFTWKLNSSINIVLFQQNSSTVTIHDDYKDRVQFFPQSFSLVLKSVQLKDSGRYTAVSFGNKDQTHATFDVSVEDPVSPVRLSVDSVWSSAQICNFTVTCSSEFFNVSRSFSCDTNSCDQSDTHSPGHTDSSIALFLSGSSIICNHSNHVNWSQDTWDYQQKCGLKDPTKSDPVVVIVVVVVVAVLVLIVVFFVFKRRKKMRKVEIQEETVYDVAQPPAPQAASGAHIELEENPSSMYSLLGPHSGPAPGPGPVPVRRENPESLYATVDKSPRLQA